MLPEIDKLVIQIMHLAYLVQTSTDYCVFISFHGHVNKLDVEIAKSKKDWQEKVLKSEFYTEFKKYYEQHDRLADLKAKRDVLLYIIQENEIPYEECSVEEYLVQEYTF